jgi:2-haloacid dehalogenase
VELTDFEALSFDCYGTLIDWEAGLLAVFGPWARARGLDMTGEELLARSMRFLGDALGAEVTADDAARLAASVPDWPAFPDSHDALAALGQRFKLIILSNVDRASFAGSNARLGVEFAKVITAQDVGSYKPSPLNFEALAREAARLGIRPGGLLHVAQSLFHDHVPAQRAGLPTVWIHRRHDRGGWGATPEPPAPVTPDWEFPSMAAFTAAVARSGPPAGG